MARKITNITNSASYYDIISQTPGNYDKQNYFLKELQDKINAEWIYRPNRVTIEYESAKANMRDEPFMSSWRPIEVVEQTVKSDKGKDISQDFLNLVFKNINEDRFTIGSKFRLGKNHDIHAEDDTKTVWLVYNTARTQATKSVAVQRCNGVLGSAFTDSQGLTHYHYEPVIQSDKLTSTGLFYNQVANAPKAQMFIIAQDNDFTRQYKLNQRFIIGARYKDANDEWCGQVYRINAIDRANSNSTYNPEDIGLITIYLEVTETSPYDNFAQRIAYQEENEVHISEDDGKYDPLDIETKYFIAFSKPEVIMKNLGSDPVDFVPILKDSQGNVISEANAHMVTSFVLENCPAGKEDRYISFTEVPATQETAYQFTLQRLKIYLNGSLTVTCRLPAEYSPTKEEIKGSFELGVREQEA